MKELILTFLKPYIDIAFTGTYALVQNLEALGIISTNNGIYLYDGKIILFVAILYSMLIISLIFFNIVSSLALSKRLTFTLILFWCLPGILHSLGLFTSTPVVPTTYSLLGGDGNMGTIAGTFVNVGIVFLFGWSFTTLLLHIFRATKKSKSLYDHIWYIFGLSTIIFFIIDTDIHRIKKDANEVEEQLLKSLTILQKQIDEVKQNCHKYDSQTLCIWSNEANKYLIQYIKQPKVIRDLLQKPSLKDITTLLAQYSNSQILNELNTINNLCNLNSNLLSCIEVPVHMNRHPLLIEDNVTTILITKFIIPLESLMPFINNKWDETIKYQKTIQKLESWPHKKWLFFLLLSLIVSIKVAYTTREYFPENHKSIYRSCLKSVAVKLWNIAWYVPKKIVEYVKTC